ncbi:CBS domain-containing protein [Actinocrinis puniceicyclus]|uniref:CBS domain-containing protein n=1 Tax=Actinocrinis puniceicyclus TaxID=977794 RepID=A0A8J8BD33_9ACTN|nr:CBS domain-containing protein [Actinocrinis puniceicyclus]MBS2964165.1 CBS domain-containing protein [Actinocrinis puniceicyclus]
MSTIKTGTATSPTSAKAASVRDVMTNDVVTVRSYATFREVAATMVNRRIGAMPVVDSIGHLIGMVSRTDLIPKEAAGAEGQSELWELLSRRGREAQARSEASAAGHLMSTNVVAVEADTSLARAAYLMERHAVTHLPVIDERRVVVGIVARSDLLRAYLRDDGEIRAEVQRALAAALAETDVVGVEVERGVVTLTGTVTRVADVTEAIRVARAVKGVVEVVDRLEPRKGLARMRDRLNPGPLF